MEMKIKDKSSFIWLAIAILFLAFSNGRLVTPAAIWIGPLFMIRFLRQNKPFPGLIIGFIAYFVAISVSYWDFFPLPGLLLFLSLVGVTASVFFIPYILDRVFMPRLRGFLSTMVFPLSYTVVEYLYFFNTNSGTWGSVAYTQYHFLPLVQIVSITGLAGITFLVTWFASVANWAWERKFSWAEIQRGAALYLGILVLVLVCGSLRLSLEYPSGGTVSAAGLISKHEIKEPFMKWIETGKCPDVQESIRELEEKTRTATFIGPKIVSWSEYTTLVSREDEALYLDAARRLARDHGIHLIISMGVMGKNHDYAKDSKNILYFIGPDGQVVREYMKRFLVPGLESPFMKRGSADMPRITTPFGIIAMAICFDFDFASYIRSGAAGADIVIVPSQDWREITPSHTYMAAFRAIENGFTVFRVTGGGLSAVFDRCGRIVGSMNYFTTGSYILIADLPAKGCRTIYSYIGDIFAGLCIVGFVALIAYAAMQGKRKTG